MHNGTQMHKQQLRAWYRNSTCTNVNIIHRCDGLSGTDLTNCISCSALSNWETWDQDAKECLGTPVTVTQLDVTITVNDTQGKPLKYVYVNSTPSIRTDINGRVIHNTYIGDTIQLSYGPINGKSVNITSQNMTVEMDVRWFTGLQPGQLIQIDCTNQANRDICMSNTKTGIIGLNHTSHPIYSLTLECQSGYEWYLSSSNYIDCRQGSGPSRTTDFSEIAAARCNGLDDDIEQSCINCTTQNWQAWDWSQKVCNNNQPIVNPTPSTPVDNTAEIKKSIKQIAGQLRTISSGFNTSRWKTANGNFNGARLASDSIAGVVLGTAGGLITSHVIKNNQINGGFDDIQCVINGQVVSNYNDDFVVGIQ